MYPPHTASIPITLRHIFRYIQITVFSIVMAEFCRFEQYVSCTFFRVIRRLFSLFIQWSMKVYNEVLIESLQKRVYLFFQTLL